MISILVFCLVSSGVRADEAAQCLLEINQRRAARKLAPFQPVGRAPLAELDRTTRALTTQVDALRRSSSLPAELGTDALKKLFPNADSPHVALTVVTGPLSAESISSALRADKSSPAPFDLFGTHDTHLALTSAKFGAGNARSLVALVAYEEVPDFSVLQLRAGVRRFFFECPDCKYRWAASLQENLTQTLACPRDGLKLLMVKPDTQRELDHVCSFFEPEKFEDVRTEIPSIHLVDLLGEIVQRCGKRLGAHVVPSASPQRPWRHSHEVWQSGQANGEEAALVLANWLAAEGFNARVVLGYRSPKPLPLDVARAAQKYPGDTLTDASAWVVLHGDGKDYLIEPTDVAPRIPTLATKSTEYWPTVQFDGTDIRFKIVPGWVTDYADPSQWTIRSKR